MTTVVSTNCKSEFLLDEMTKSSARISSTRFNSPDDNSINEPLQNLVLGPLLLLLLMTLLLLLLLLVLLELDVDLPEYGKKEFSLDSIVNAELALKLT